MKYILKLIAKTSFKVASWCNYQLGLPQSKRVKPWFKNNGDETLRLNYPELNEGSIVFDLGGYKGQWASDIYARYNCAVYIFEPYSIYANNIRDRFAKNNKIHLF